MTGGAFQFLVSRGENKEGSLSDENVEREGRPSAPLPRPPSPWPYPVRLRLKRGELPARQCASPASPLHVLSAALASHDYILKIVPTVYEDKSGKQQYSYQYTVANKVRGRRPGPAACNRALCWPRAAATGVWARFPLVPFAGTFPGGCPGQALSLGEDGRPVSESRGGSLTGRQGVICVRRSRQVASRRGPRAGTCLYSPASGLAPSDSGGWLSSTRQTPWLLGRKRFI